MKISRLSKAATLYKALLELREGLKSVEVENQRMTFAASDLTISFDAYTDQTLEQMREDKVESIKAVIFDIERELIELGVDLES